MDPFDDILPGAPAPRARPGVKFMPKAKSKQSPRKEISASENANSSKDGKNVHVDSSPASIYSEGISRNECHNAVASTLSEPVEESMRSNQVELTKLEDATNSKMGNPPQVSVNRDTAASVDDQPFMVEASQANPVGFEVGSVTKFIPETNLNDGTKQPVHSANAVKNLLNNVDAPSTTCSTIGSIKEPPKSGEGPFFDSNKSLEIIDNTVQADPDVGFKGALDDKVVISESNIPSYFNFGREQEVLSAEFELDPFSTVLPDSGATHKFQPKIKPRPRVSNTPAVASASSSIMMEKSVELPTSFAIEVQSFKSSGDCSNCLSQSTSLPLPTSEIHRTTDLSNKFDHINSSIPFSGDNRSSAAVTPSRSDSLNAKVSEVVVHNGTRDWPSSFGKSAGETADIFSGLESLDDFLTQAATETGKPALHSFNEKGMEENFAIRACSSIDSFAVRDTTQVQRCPEYHTSQESLTFNEDAVLSEDNTHTDNRRLETEEVVDLNPTYSVDNIFDYQSIKSGTDPTSEIPGHEELTNAADSPTLADFLHRDVAGEKEDAEERKTDGAVSSSLRKCRRSSFTAEEDKGGGKTSRQLRKRAARKPAETSLNEDVEDDNDFDPPYTSNRDELEENDDDDYAVDYSSKKKRESVSSKKKSMVKNGKTSRKRKKTEDDLEKTSEKPPKKFSHSTRRRKRYVDKALLDDEHDPRTLPIKDIISLAEYRERVAKKEATTSKTSSTNQSGGDSLHEAGANNEEENSGSEYGRDPGDDQASDNTLSTSSLYNYQSFMDKQPRAKWSNQETENFYEGLKIFGANFSMLQLKCPGKTRDQIKLKYKKEERQHPLRLSDVLNNHVKDPSIFKLVIEQLQQASTKAEKDPSRDASDIMTGEEVEELTPETNEEVATTKQDADVKDQEDSVSCHSPEQSDDDDGDEDFQVWLQYKTGC